MPQEIVRVRRTAEGVGTELETAIPVMVIATHMRAASPDTPVSEIRVSFRALPALMVLP
jgi:hypothetical protein